MARLEAKGQDHISRRRETAIPYLRFRGGTGAVIGLASAVGPTIRSPTPFV